MRINDWTQTGGREESSPLPGCGQQASLRCLGVNPPSSDEPLDLDECDDWEGDDEDVEVEPPVVPLLIQGWPHSYVPRHNGTSSSSTVHVARVQNGSATQSAPTRTTLRTPSVEKTPAPSVQKTPAPSVPVAPPSSGPELRLPPRDREAATGSQFLERTRSLNRTQREAAILQEIQKGNVPDFARHMKEVSVSSTGPDGQHHTGTVHVMPDYLAIGSNDDFVRIPMDPLTAQRIADQTGTTLPTTKIVDEVYRQAEVKLKPQPLPAGAQMMSNQYYERHQGLVENQLAGLGAAHGELTAGHQKDVVISNMATQHPGRVAIYGWHQPNGKPIQPLSTVHENTYADYSHGVRLVGGTMVVDGVERPVSEVLADPNLAGLVSKEGVIREPRYRLP